MPSHDLILAIDGGTGSIRAAVFDVRGRLLHQAAQPIATLNHGVSSEVDPNDILRAVGAAIAAAVEQPSRIAVIGVTAAIGLLVVDQDGKPLTPIITWQDRRSVSDSATIARRINPLRIYSITGRRIDPELTFPKLLWFERNAPDILARARHVLSVKDWLVQQLCGEAVTDPSSASYSLLFDVTRGEWSRECLEAFGLRPDILPPVRAADAIAGFLTSAATGFTGLRAGTPVVVGGPDGTMGGIGAGMVGPGIAVDVIGTTDVIFTYTDQPVFDPRQRLVLNAFPMGAAWSVGGPTSATGGAASWLATLFGRELVALTAEAAAVPPGSDGLMMSPVLAGSRTPRWDAAERGGLAGLSLAHGHGHLFRALLEGCAYDVAEVFDALREHHLPLKEIRAAGGGTDSDLWLSIRAAVMNQPIVIPEIVEASALGAAMVAAIGIGFHRDLATASLHMVRPARRIEPDPAWAEAYVTLRREHMAFRRRLLELRTPDRE